MLSCFPRLLGRARPLVTPVRRMFSDFDGKDETEIQNYMLRKYSYKPYLRMRELWQKPLEKKRLRQERIRVIKENKEKTPEQQDKLVIHSAPAGIEYPTAPGQMFCVVEIDGFQYKIMENCRVILDERNDLNINDKVTWSSVLLIASKDFTMLGRPLVANAKVEAIVQEKLKASKVIVFKKKRRKQYKRSFGCRAKLTALRVTKIVYEIGPEKLSKAVALL